MPDPVIAAKALSHISLKVTDIERSIAWYGAIFGYDLFLNGHAPTPDRSRHCIGLLGEAGFALELLQVPGPAEAPGSNTLGPVGLSLTVDDAAAALAAFRAAGHADATPVIEADAWKVVFLRDPDGNIVELVQQPHGAATIADLAPRLRVRGTTGQAQSASL